MTVHETLAQVIRDIGGVADPARLADDLLSDRRLVIGTAPAPVPERPPLWGPEGPVVGQVYPVEADGGVQLLVRWKGGYWELVE